MQYMARMLWVWAIGIFAIFCGVGCMATSGQNNHYGDDDVRSQVEAEFGPLTEEQIAGFERELETQYRQLDLAYSEYDRVRQAPPGQVKHDHEEHRLHRRLMRRHRTLARLHEDRLWLYMDRQGSQWDDRGLAEMHRAASRWHELRFRDDGEGIEEQDEELEALRRQIEGTGPLAVPDS